MLCEFVLFVACCLVCDIWCVLRVEYYVLLLCCVFQCGVFVMLCVACCVLCVECCVVCVVCCVFVYSV